MSWITDIFASKPKYYEVTVSTEERMVGCRFIGEPKVKTPFYVQVDKGYMTVYPVEVSKSNGIYHVHGKYGVVLKAKGV